MRRSLRSSLSNNRTPVTGSLRQRLEGRSKEWKIAEGTPLQLVLRAATADDIEDIATVWHDGWRDGHLGHVPASVEEHRRLADFRRRVPTRLAMTTVATIDGDVVGFVMVVDDEIEQIYVARRARGNGVAAALLCHGERAIAARFDQAWLAVIAGNSRGRRFYARYGWYDAGTIDYLAQTVSGTISIASRRYEKSLIDTPRAGDIARPNRKEDGTRAGNGLVA